MGIRINTNVAANSARRHLFNTTTQHRKSLAKLGSGLRINSAADDSAGLAISEGLKKGVRTLDQAVRNAADGISLVQTAEGYLDEVSNILVRMNELAEQSLNGTLGTAERSFLSDEYYALRDEINRIGSAAEFNGVKLLDGSGGTVPLQVGQGTAGSDRIDLDLSRRIHSDDIPLVAGVWSEAMATAAMGELDKAISYIATARSDFGAIQNRLESTIRSIRGTSENLSAANSRIRDVDVAAETSTLTSYEVLQNAGVSVLGQANLAPMAALNLMGLR